MKNIKLFLTLILLMVLVSLLWVNTGNWEIDKENYISKKVLELSVPFDVRINIEFLESLESTQSAPNTTPSVEETTNESSRTSPERI